MPLDKNLYREDRSVDQCIAISVLVDMLGYGTQEEAFAEAKRRIGDAINAYPDSNVAMVLRSEDLQETYLETPPLGIPMSDADGWDMPPADAGPSGNGTD